MRILHCLKVAQDMGLPRQYAVNARQRYITRRLDEIDSALVPLNAWLETSLVNAAFVGPMICDLLIEKCQLIGEAQFMKTQMHDDGRLITVDMIERARQYPVQSLVGFRKNKAKAWCHDDNNPSLYFGSRSNRAVCPVCDKKFDAIAILMTRDGMAFHDAVRQLAGSC